VLGLARSTIATAALLGAAWSFGCGTSSGGSTPQVQQTNQDAAADAGSHPTGLKALSVAVGAYHACALLTDHTVECWGVGSQVAAPIVTTPAVVPGLSGVMAIASKGELTCAMLSDASVECWGMDVFTVAPTATDYTTPVVVPSLAGAKSLSMGGVGSDSLCALMPGGDVQCHGGIVSSSMPPVDAGEVATAVATGLGAACAVVSGGAVSCWGAITCVIDQCPDYGPAPIPGLTGATAIAEGNEHACALLGNGSVVCWGSNAEAQLGTLACGDAGAGSTCPVPTAVPGLSRITAIAAGGYGTCALSSGGVVQCWGAGPFDSTTVGVRCPDPVTEEGPPEDSGASVLLSAPPYCVAPPATLLTTGATAIDVGDSNACALMTDGSVQCWGPNNYGVDGQGPDSDSGIPEGPYIVAL